MREEICREFKERIEALKDPLRALMSVKARFAWREAKAAKPKTLGEFYEVFGKKMSQAHEKLMVCGLEE